MKILFVHPTLSFGGAEAQRLALLEKWNLSGYQPSILCIEKKGDIGKRIEAMGIKVYCLNQPSKPYNIKATFLIWFFLLKNRFDIVQTCLFNANFHGRIAAFLAGVRFIFSEEHSEHYQYTSFKFMPNIIADNLLSKVTDSVICCCDTLKGDIAKLEKIKHSKFTTIFSSLDFDKLKQVPENGDIRKRMCFAETDFIIGNVGSMSPRKGQEYLVQAFALIAKKAPVSRLIFIGYEYEAVRNKLEILAKKLNIRGNVHFFGKQERAVDYYSIMDVFVLSSLCEGIPLVILEAMYMGVPVVSTDVGGVREIIKHNHTGILVKPQDPEAIANAVTELFFDKQKRLGMAKAAKENSLDKFKPQRYLSELEKLYCTTINGKHNR